MTLEDLLRAVMDRVFQRTRFHGFYLYEVTEDHAALATNGAHDPAEERLTLRRVGDEKGPPDHPRVEKRYGSHGLNCRSTPGSMVLVGFEGGDPDRPFIGFYLPAPPGGTPAAPGVTGHPVSVLVDADTYVQVGTTDPERPDKRVFVGSKDRLPVARETDPVACGVLSFAPDPAAGTTTVITYTPQGGIALPVGVIAAPFTPNPATNGLIGVQGKVMGGSTLFRSE